MFRTLYLQFFTIIITVSAAVPKMVTDIVSPLLRWRVHLLNIQLFITNPHKYSLHNFLNTWYILVVLWYVLAVLFTHVAALFTQVKP